MDLGFVNVECVDVNVGDDCLDVFGVIEWIIFLGKGGEDVLIGGDGDDVFEGGVGNDCMVGGLGDDCFVVG